jgi:hypothetical protein
MKVAYKLLSRDKATFEDLTTSEQQLWNSFKIDQTYRLLTGEPDTVPEFRFNWYTVTSADGTAEFILDQAPQVQARITTAARSRPPPTVPEPKVKPPKASTSTRAAQPSSSSSSSTPSTVPLLPTASTSGTVPKRTAQAKSTTGLSATPSKSPSPTPTPAPAPTSAKGSGGKLRDRPDVNYKDLHLGRNLLLGRQEFLKGCNTTLKSVGKAVQQTLQKVLKVAKEFPVIS